MASRHCLGRLDAYLEGALPARSGRRVERHLAACPDCSRIARDRARVLTAARSVAAPPPSGPSPVLRERGVSGRLVVGVLTFVVLVGGLLMAVWTAGAPRTVAAARSTAQPADAVGLVQGRSGDRTAVPAVIEDLRAHGWTVPSLANAGLTPLAVRSARQGDAVVVSVDWGGATPVATVHECRSEADAPAPRACGDAEAGLTAAVAETRLPGGVAYRLADAADGSGWTATFSTARAAYRVGSSLPRSQAPSLLGQLVAAERSGLTEVRREDPLGDRIERGLQRVTGAVPTGALAAARP